MINLKKQWIYQIKQIMIKNREALLLKNQINITENKTNNLPKRKSNKRYFYKDKIIEFCQFK